MNVYRNDHPPIPLPEALRLYLSYRLSAIPGWLSPLVDYLRHKGRIDVAEAEIVAGAKIPSYYRLFNFYADDTIELRSM